MHRFLFRFIFSTVIAISALMPLQANAQKGEKTFGVKAGYVTANQSATAGISFDYRFSRHFSLAPNIDYIFRRDNTDAFIFNVDAHFPFAVSGTRFEIYPLAGITYASWTFHHLSLADVDAVSRLNHFGLNVGAGASLKLSSTLRLSLEGKWSAVDDRNTGIFTLGIGYVF